jgi:signal transduction histidine kinase
MLTAILGVICIMLVTVALMYLYIALRTQLDPSLLYFSITLLFICAIAAIDIWLQPWRFGPEGSDFWIRQQHVLFGGVVPSMYAYLLRLTGRPWTRNLKLLAGTAVLLAIPFVYGDSMLRREGHRNLATPLYNWVFTPMFVLLVGVTIWLLLRGVRSATGSQRRVLIVHFVGLAALALASAGDVLTINIPEISDTPGFIIFGLLAFGLSTTVAFGDRLLGLVNDRRRAYAKLEDAYRELDNANALCDLGRSAAFVNHEVRNQLGVVSLGLEALRNAGDLGEEGQVRLQALERTIERLARFSQDILALSRGKLEVAKEPARVGALIRRCTGQLWPDWQDRVVLRHVPENLEVAADAGKLEQAVSNVLLNAFEASATRVWVDAFTTPRSVLIKFEDDGTGCPPAEVDELFRAFYTTKSRAAGAGLGLSLVKAIAESHGGRISAYTKSYGENDDHGLILIMALPRTPVEAAAADLNVTVVKENMPEVGRIVRLLHNADVVPHIAETMADVDPESQAVLVGNAARGEDWPEESDSARMHFVTLDEGVPVVSVRGGKPQLLSEDYVVRELGPSTGAE